MFPLNFGVKRTANEVSPATSEPTPRSIGGGVCTTHALEWSFSTAARPLPLPLPRARGPVPSLYVDHGACVSSGFLATAAVAKRSDATASWGD